MRKGVLRLLFAVLIIFIIATLTFLYITIKGAINGSFEIFPHSDDVAVKRGVYIMFTVIIAILDVFAITGVLKLFKAVGFNKINRVKALALFWRYGFIILWIGSFYFLFRTYLFFSVSAVIYGIYTFIIALFGLEHFICGMQNAYHKKMTPYSQHPPAWIKKIKKEGIIIGVIFFIMGIILLILKDM